MLLILGLLMVSCAGTEYVSKPNTYQPNKTNLERSLYK